ncbi:hypothetical protein OH459_27445 [Vibrio sp. MM46]|uniref:hypothetical protein n=1 Tax=Vibrio sp. MM46 TaxID=2998835 RepID=UPI0022CDA60A|nr:hypothetical protein [Vibrio sp. MM46]MDA0126315.1 hypothetical protein [Vibrio sp. MM46]
MPKTKDKAKRVIAALAKQVPIHQIKQAESKDDADWFRVSKKAYDIYLKKEREKRKESESKPNVLCTSVNEIKGIISLNDKLADYALSIPAIATMSEVKEIEKLIGSMPNNEHSIISILENSTMCPRVRALQKKGRFEHFPPFKEFSAIIEAATISFYRGNFIAAYLTLIPVVEGVVLRWLGYSGEGKKPEFEDLRKFFRNSHTRQPCPGNALFYEVYSKACDKLLTEHLFKPSDKGDAYSNFNRHLAAHLLNSSQFATKDNCIRLFLLLDVMTELYYYETYCVDPRFNLTGEQIALELDTYCLLKSQTNTVEEKLLGKP